MNLSFLGAPSDSQNLQMSAFQSGQCKIMGDFLQKTVDTINLNKNYALNIFPSKQTVILLMLWGSKVAGNLNRAFVLF